MKLAFESWEPVRDKLSVLIDLAWILKGQLCASELAILERCITDFLVDAELYANGTMSIREVVMNGCN